MTQLLNARGIASALVLCLLAQAAGAADELLLYVFEGDTPVADAEVILDGDFVGTSRRDGSFFADLSEGAHVVSVETPDGGARVVRFSAGSGQLVDAVVDVASSEAPHVDVFSRTESAADRRNAPEGTLRIAVVRGSSPAANRLVMLSSGQGAVSTNAQGIGTKVLPRGLYTASVGDVSVQARVVGGVTRTVRLALPDEGNSFVIERPTLEEVFVIATFDPTGLEVSERDTSNIVDTIGVEMLTRFSDSDVAASVVRVPGISVQDDKYVFIRGLGGRYISSTLNNATMPSTNPSKRTVPLDLFPSNFVSQLDIKKTFLPYMPGESTGGNLVINTKTFPDERSFGLSATLGYTADLTGETVFVDPIDDNLDWLGWDDGAREESSLVRAIAGVLDQGGVEDPQTGEFIALDSASTGELQLLGASLIKDGFDPDFSTATPDASVGVNYGDLFYFDDAELGFYSALNYSSEWSQRNKGERYTYESAGEIADNYLYRQYSHSIEISALLALGLNIGDSTFEWNNVLSRVTESQLERSVGQEGDEFQSVYRHSIQWEERQYASTQLTGSHFLNEGGSLFGEWQVTASQAWRYAPDRREAEFRASSRATDPEALKAGYDFRRSNAEQGELFRGFALEPGTIVRRFDDLVDDNFDGSFDLTWDAFDDGASYAKVQAGIQSIYRKRDSDTRSYGFNINQAREQLLRSDNALVGEVVYLCDEDAGDDCTGGISDSPNSGLVFDNKTLASDSYDAELKYNSVYALYDHTFENTWQVVFGARFERYEQTTNTFSLQGEQAQVQSTIDEDSVLPSLGVNWFYSDTQQLRLAVSQTVARPDFKEAANATFYDNEFNFRVRGNPYLGISDIFNADLRWEWYPNETDSYSIAAFYKDMQDPIERVVQLASGTAGNSRTFQNSEQAELYGVELEGRTEFVLTKDYNQTLFVSFNASWIESEVTAANQDPRALQGQPEYTANLVLGYDNLNAGHQLTVLMNQNGEAISDVGVSGQPNIVFEPRLEINLVYRYDLSDAITLKAKVENLLDEEVEYTQGGKTFQKYEKGLAFQVGFDWNF